MRKKNYALKVVAVFSASMICLSGCGGAGSSSKYFEKATDDQTVPTIAEEMEEDESEEPKKGSKKESKKEPEEETQKEESSENTSEPVDFYAAMDEYEIFFGEYIAFMEEYNESDDPTIYMDDYADFMNQYAKTMEAMTNIDMGSLTNEELAYYTEVTTRIYGKLAESGM